MAGYADVSQISRELLTHCSRILDPSCLSEERLQHQKVKYLQQTVVDEFREKSPFCISCGLQLVQESEPWAIKLGLDLLEHFIRFRWRTLNQEEQIDLRHKMLELSRNIVNSGTPLLLYVKEGVAKCIVELVKNMWPQFWPTFVQELCEIGNQQTHLELILLVYRRLIEDVTAGFDIHLKSHRKSDLMTEMKTEPFLMPLFKLLFSVLETYSQNSPSSLMEVAVTTITSFADWVDIKYLTMDNGRILGLLFNIVSSPLSSHLQIQACDCLIDIVSKKGEIRANVEYRRLFLLLLSKDVLECIHRVAFTQVSTSQDEDDYLLVKRLCQLMVQIGTCQIVPLVSAEVLPLPDNLMDYLSLMLVFVQHPSQLIVSNCLEVWCSLINSQIITRNEGVLSVLPQLLQLLRLKQLKVGDPDMDNHPSCLYASFDFNGSTEHNIFFSKFKGIVNRAISIAVPLVPVQASEQVLALIQELVQKTYPPTEPNELSRNCPIYLEWDGAISFVECWINGLRMNRLLQQVASIGVAILDMVLSFNPTHVTLMSCHIKMLEGGLQCFVIYNERVLLQKYLEKIVTCVVYPSEQVNKISLTRDQKQVRLGSLYCLTNLVKGYTTALLSGLVHYTVEPLYCGHHWDNMKFPDYRGVLISEPATDQLFEYYMKLIQSDCLQFSERSLFIETFTTLSHFRSGQEQLLMMNKLLEEVVSLANTEMKAVVCGLPNFIQYLGLDKELPDPVFGDNGAANYNRGKLCFCVHVTMGVFQRCTLRERRNCKAPNKSDYLISLMPLLVPLILDFIMPLIKMFHLLWSNESKPFLSGTFQQLHSLSQYEREIILGTSTSPTAPDRLSKILSQLTIAYDHCVMAVGFACPTFGLTALSEVGYVESIVHCVFEHLSQTKQLRLKPIIRNLMIPVVLMCPSEHWKTILIPLVAHFCHITFNCLQTSWSNIMESTLHAPTNQEDEQTITDEVIHQHFIIYLTRQYIQLIETLCIKRQDSATDATRATNGGPVMPIGGSDFVVLDSASMETSGKDQTTNKGQQLSDLAVMLLRSEIQEIILLSIVAPLRWSDGFTTRKSITIAMATFEKISVVEFGQDVVLQILDQIFLALQTHGEDDNIMLQLVILALLIYESSVVGMPAVSQKISKLPGCSPDKVEKFNCKLASQSNDPGSKPGKVTKWKREEFKRLLSGIIGKPIGQLHKNTPVFLDLPSLVVKKSHRLKDKHKRSSSAPIVEGIGNLFGTD